MKKLGIAVLPLLALAAPALAQSDPSVTGPHIEAHLGWDSLPVPDMAGQTGARSPSSSLLYGAGLGYDVDLGHRLFAGIDSNLDLGGSTHCTGPILSPVDSVCGKMVRDWDIGARLGVKTDYALVYGRVAYDNSRVRSTYLPGDGSSAAVSNDYGGLRLGGGVQVPVAKAAYIKAEYRYTTASGLPDQNQLLAGVGLHF